jgi:hypothetical protein
LYIQFRASEINMLTDITFTADEALLEKARAKALARNTTLEEEILRWLQDLAQGEIEGERRVAKFRETMEKLGHVEWDGRKLTRDELNEH